MSSSNITSSKFTLIASEFGDRIKGVFTPATPSPSPVITTYFSSTATTASTQSRVTTSETSQQKFYDRLVELTQNENSTKAEIFEELKKFIPQFEIKLGVPEHERSVFYSALSTLILDIQMSIHNKTEFNSLQFISDCRDLNKYMGIWAGQDCLVKAIEKICHYKFLTINSSSFVHKLHSKFPNLIKNQVDQLLDSVEALKYATLGLIPADVMRIIYSMLSQKDLKSLACTCKKFAANKQLYNTITKPQEQKIIDFINLNHDTNNQLNEIDFIKEGKFLHNYNEAFKIFSENYNKFNKELILFVWNWATNLEGKRKIQPKLCWMGDVVGKFVAFILENEFYKKQKGLEGFITSDKLEAFAKKYLEEEKILINETRCMNVVIFKVAKHTGLQNIHVIVDPKSRLKIIALLTKMAPNLELTLAELKNRIDIFNSTPYLENQHNFNLSSLNYIFKN